MKEKVKKDIEILIKKMMISHDEEDMNGDEKLPEEYLRYIDSIRFIELVTAIENKYSIELENDDLNMKIVENLDSLIGVILKYIEY